MSAAGDREGGDAQGVVADLVVEALGKVQDREDGLLGDLVNGLLHVPHREGWRLNEFVDFFVIVDLPVPRGRRLADVCIVLADEEERRGERRVGVFNHSRCEHLIDVLVRDLPEVIRLPNRWQVDDLALRLGLQRDVVRHDVALAHVQVVPGENVGICQKRFEERRLELLRDVG